MWLYVARRITFLPFMLIAVSMVTFVLGQYGPGDPVAVRMGQRYDPDSIATKNLRRELGLDRPFHVQYADYVWGFVRGDFGESLNMHPGQPVRGLITKKMWVSARLALAAMAISLGLGLPLGFYIAHRQGEWQDPAAVTGTLVLMSIPVMVSVPALTVLFCLKLHWVPCSGWGGLFDTRIIVPALAMGVPGIAGIARLMRASTLDVLGQDFIRTAHAKGLTPVRVDTRHVLRNALIPIITVLAFSLAGLIGGAFIIERLMGIPGVGRLTIDAIFARDYPIIMAVVLIGAIAFVLANLLADLAYAFIDPRIRYQ